MCTLHSSLLLIIQIIGMADDCKGEVKKSSLETEHIRQYMMTMSYCTYSYFVPYMHMGNSKYRSLHMSS